MSTQNTAVGNAQTENRTSSEIHLRTHEIIPAIVNDKIYRPVNKDDPDIRALALSIAKHGLLEPIVVTQDKVVLSGHRRLVACKLARLAFVPVRYTDIHSSDPDFIERLVAHNKQRTKSLDEVLREQVIETDPEVAYQRLIEYRRSEAQTNFEKIELRDAKKRSRITKAKQPMVDAINRIFAIHQHRLPLSARQIHYLLLNNPPLRHASKPDSTYRNDQKFYADLTDLLTRMRMTGMVPFRWIKDDTRPFSTHRGHRCAEDFIGKELKYLFSGYRRDLMQSQPNHVEVIGEKMTIETSVAAVTERYSIPYTIGRGYSSTGPRADIVSRYRKSGKEKLIVIALSDFDPDGEEIAHSFVRSLRDDFGVDDVIGVRAALTREQAEQYDLPKLTKAKSKSSSHKRFVESNDGESWVWELEALQPDDLEDLLRASIEQVIDVELYQREIEQERNDASRLEGARVAIRKLIGDVDLFRDYR